MDVEFIHLLHDVHLKGIPNHLYRGYTITGLKSFNRRIREIENCSDTKKPIWFVFSGMDLRCFETGKGNNFDRNVSFVDIKIDENNDNFDDPNVIEYNVKFVRSSTYEIPHICQSNGEM